MLFNELMINGTVSVINAILPGKVTYTKDLFEITQFSLRKNILRCMVVFTRSKSCSWSLSHLTAHGVCVKYMELIWPLLLVVLKKV